MAKNLRVVIIGFGPFGREVEQLIRGEVSELLIIGREAQHLEQFNKDDENNNENVRVLRGEVDETSINQALGWGEDGLKIIPPPDEEGGETENDKKREKTVDVAIVDMADIGMNDYVVGKVSPYARLTVAAMRNSAHAESLKKLGAQLVICPEKEAAERFILTLYGLKVYDLRKISDGLREREAKIEIPEHLTGKSVLQIYEEFGVRVVYIIRSIPDIQKKKIMGYTEELLYPLWPTYCIDVHDTLMVIHGTLSRIKRLGSKSEE